MSSRKRSRGGSISNVQIFEMPDETIYVQTFKMPEKKIFGIDSGWKSLHNAVEREEKRERKQRITKTKRRKEAINNAVERQTHINNYPKYTKLYHFTKQELPPLNRGNMVQTNGPTWYHSASDWRYFDKKARGSVVLKIPTDKLFEIGMPSKCYSQQHTNNKCFITWILPKGIATFDRENTVKYNFQKGGDRNIRRYHLTWVEPRNILNVKTKNNNGLGTVHYTGEYPF